MTKSWNLNWIFLLSVSAIGLQCFELLPLFPWTTIYHSSLIRHFLSTSILMKLFYSSKKETPITLFCFQICIMNCNVEIEINIKMYIKIGIFLFQTSPSPKTFIRFKNIKCLTHLSVIGFFHLLLSLYSDFYSQSLDWWSLNFMSRSIKSINEDPSGPSLPPLYLTK